MADILIRDLDKLTVQRLKARAQRNGRSLQSEAKQLLERAAGVGAAEVDAILDTWAARLAGRRMARSARLLREDRNR